MIHKKIYKRSESDNKRANRKILYRLKIYIDLNPLNFLPAFYKQFKNCRYKSSF